ncbi:hypothetical protein HHI36_020057 [Cryptolaemus montrouzieri]|uniref:Uncharacterized protein n=1 Tax=Cryptolaemus montrouzieri TaxID=559131 RepID=A0ABD2N9I6_9CUCU
MMRWMEDIFFNQQCLTNQTIPKYIQNKFKKEKSKLADKFMFSISRRMIKNEIKVIYHKLNNININLKLKYHAMKQLCPYEELNRRCGAEVKLTVENFLNNDVETKDLMKPLKRKEHHSTKVNIGLTKEEAFNDKVIKSIQKKLKEEKLMITEEDKGNCVVIVKKEVYNQKISEFLNNNGIK